LVGIKQAFIVELGRQNGEISEFDERIWFGLVDFAMVYRDTDVQFIFKNGAGI